MRNSTIPCWQCGKKLQLHRVTGKVIFAEVSMPLGTASVRVHKQCKPEALRALDMTPRPEEEGTPHSGLTLPKRLSDDR